ncbi:MAG TPA: tripartite tricarboxylate transporter substrate binding protein [Burkholderiales bacterium]|nr:tripartite tricarboxylate transporter substrate binding protein [Burkholderiales bacterium]
MQRLDSRIGRMAPGAGTAAGIALLACACMALAPLPVRAQAQDWPTRPVRVIVPFPAGGPADVLGRMIAARFTEALGQQFVIDNRGGANGNIGAGLLARAPADGYTIMFATTGPLALNKLMYRSAAFDPTRDFAPIILFGEVPLIVVANPALPVKTLQELVAYARANPGKLSYASPSFGSMGHLSAELIQRSAGFSLTHVPYKGSAPAVTDVIGGSVNLAFDLVTTYVQHVKAGTVRALATTASRRAAALPDVPTVTESGVSGYQATGWYAIAGPAGMPQQAILRLNGIANAYLASPEGASRLQDLGVRPIGGTPAEMAQFVRSEIAKWRPVIEPIASKLE